MNENKEVFIDLRDSRVHNNVANYNTLNINVPYNEMKNENILIVYNLIYEYIKQSIPETLDNSVFTMFDIHTDLDLDPYNAFFIGSVFADICMTEKRERFPPKVVPYRMETTVLNYRAKMKIVTRVPKYHRVGLRIRDKNGVLFDFTNAEFKK